MGIDGVGFDGGNALIEEMSKTMPWLQDTPKEDVWTRWGAVYRDVIVVDEANRRVFTFNTDERPLEFPDNLAALRTQLLQAAGEPLD